MHCKFLLELLDLPLHFLEEQFGILLHVNNGLVAHLHHATSELECGNGLLKVLGLGVYVGDHDSLTVATDGVLKEVSQLGLSVRNMISLVVAH
jgi:hypothetical protein